MQQNADDVKRFHPAGGIVMRPAREIAYDEKLLAIQTYCRIRLRGSRGGLFFVDRRRLEAMMGRDPHAEVPIASVFPLDADVRHSVHG
jgi:hypothetical protein